MKIASADVAMSSGHLLRQEYTRRETLVQGGTRTGSWNPEELTNRSVVENEETGSTPLAPGPSLLDLPEASPPPGLQTTSALSRSRLAEAASRLTAAALSDIETLTSGMARSLYQPLPAWPVPEADSSEAAGLTAGPLERTRIQLLMATMEQLTGRKFDVLEPSELSRRLEEAYSTETPAAVAAQGQPAEGAQRPEGPAWGMHYTLHERQVEMETTSFSADATVKTADGRDIQVQVDLAMSRQFVSENHVEVHAGAALQDPLVVNFEGTAAELSQTTFAFDLDMDGADDQVRFVGPGSAFLALDANGNGTVDDGSELFGPTSGDGFAELAAHDEDGNQWIDEQDSVYSRLRLWTRDEAGNEQLMALGQRGVGAIYLGKVATPFEVKDGNNQLQGAVRTSGIYLNEDGSAGSVQQLDLVV